MSTTMRWIMPHDHEELPSLEEVRLKLRDLHFSEYHRDHPARQQLYEKNIAGVIQRGRQMWERVRSEPKAVEHADDWAKGEPLLTRAMWCVPHRRLGPQSRSADRARKLGPSNDSKSYLRPMICEGFRRSA